MNLTFERKQLWRTHRDCFLEAQIQTLHVNTALVEAHYLPCIAYFSAIISCNRIVVEKYEHYQKQSYRNRCYILGPHRTEVLIIPVTAKHGKPLVCDVRIDYSQKWLNNHWRTIRTAYGNAPYFEYYGFEIHDILFKRHTFLYDLNLELLKICLKWVKKDAELTESDKFQNETGAGVKDFRGVINPKKEDYCNRLYKSTEYQQVFGSKFVPNLSIVDLIFNEGPGAPGIVKASEVK